MIKAPVGPVGLGGINSSDDVKIVQQLLIWYVEQMIAESADKSFKDSFAKKLTCEADAVATKAPAWSQTTPLVKTPSVQTPSSSWYDLIKAAITDPVKATGTYDQTTQTAIDLFQTDLVKAGSLEAETGLVEPFGTTIQRLWPVRYANPTGGGMRPYAGEAGADQYAHASAKTHHGTDWFSSPPQQVYAFMSGVVDGQAYPYYCPDYVHGGREGECKNPANLCGLGKNGYCYLHGVNITASSGRQCQMFYLESTVPINTIVRAGDVVGTAQSLATKYKAMPDHIHVQMPMPNVVGRPKSFYNPADFVKV